MGNIEELRTAKEGELVLLCNESKVTPLLLARFKRISKGLDQGAIFVKLSGSFAIDVQQAYWLMVPGDLGDRKIPVFKLIKEDVVFDDPICAYVGENQVIDLLRSQPVYEVYANVLDSPEKINKPQAEYSEIDPTI